MRFNSFRVRALALALIASAACSHKNSPESEPEPLPDPISVRVKNENFLDMNVAVVTTSVSRRLGTVTGNAVATFTIPWNVANGNTIAITATPIGGRGQATTGGLNVSPGQVIEFRVGAILRQSGVSVHDP